MANLNIGSESEEMYLVKLAHLLEDGHQTPVPLPILAQALGVQPASANQMVRRLSEMGLLRYEPYRGVAFTPAGNRLTQTILRFRRLWAVFLAHHLGFSPVEADTLACALEHQTTPALADRLDRFLGFPRQDPLGKPIPEQTDEAIQPTGAPLSALPVGAAGQIIRIPEAGPVRDFLLAGDIRPGKTITVNGKAEGDALLVASGDRLVCLSADIAGQIVVLPTQVKEMA